MATKKTSKIDAPAPLTRKGHPVDWWFAFKFNAGTFPGCGSGTHVKVGSSGLFGGKRRAYDDRYSQQYVYASSESPELIQGKGCLGTTQEDPVGATFAQVYFGDYFYVVWNDQFYDDPKIHGCDRNCDAPWGHSKGVVAWNADGEGFVMQVSTPSWPASGNEAHPRKTDGNTLGCIKDDDIEVSQHFFATRLNADDLIAVLTALGHSSVATDPKNPQIVRNGGPKAAQDLVKGLGEVSKGHKASLAELSTGIRLISKPSELNVPPWQMVSALLGGLPLRVASWWAHPAIYSTDSETKISCWDDSLGKPGPVEIATTGCWDGTEIGLEGGEGKDYNHAKFGVTTSKKDKLCIFGDMNQQGALRPGYAYSGQKCESSQNGRGGMFYVVDDAKLFASVTSLLTGKSAPVK